MDHWKVFSSMAQKNIINRKLLFWGQPQLRPVVSSEQLPQPQSPTMAVQTLALLLLILVMGSLSSSGKLAIGILENFCVWKTTLVPF